MIENVTGVNHSLNCTIREMRWRWSPLSKKKNNNKRERAILLQLQIIESQNTDTLHFLPIVKDKCSIVMHTENPNPHNTATQQLSTQKSPNPDPGFISTRQATHSEHVCPLCLTNVE
jgi:hypothetical protein